MKKTSSELKRMARETLSGRWGIPVAASLLATLLPTLCMLPFTVNVEHPTTSQSITMNLASFIITLLQIILTSGVLSLHLNMSRKQSYSLNDLTYGFRQRPQRFVGAYLLLTLISMLPVIPGSILVVTSIVFSYTSSFLGFVGIILLIVGIVFTIIIELQYSLIFYLLVDFPNEKVTDLFKRSKYLMNGNKGRAFYLSLSFIGWILLGVCSFGIGLLWIYPYMIQTQTCLYLDIYDEKSDVI